MVGGGLLGILLAWWFKVDSGLPEATLERDSGVVGRQASWVVNLRTPGRAGVRTVEIRLVAGDRIFSIAERHFEAQGWFGSGVEALRIPVEVDLGEIGVPQGAAVLEVLAETYGWRVFDRQMPTVGRFPQQVDRTPPSAQVVSDQHNIRLGGSAAAVFRIDADAEEMVVRVGRYRFPVTREYFTDPELALALFAAPEDLAAGEQPVLSVSDQVGNTVEVPIFSTIRHRDFRERRLEISEGFLRRKIPQIYAARGLASPDDLLEAYLGVNRDIRRSSEETLRALSPRSKPFPLWSGAFGRLARSQTMSEFGDRRSYSYDGRVIDRQTHLGVDLASLKRAEVGASQDGIVAFADDLGIYGETVVIDHGLGLSTLYGHLSSIAVAEGDRVSAGQVIGNTGESGLAGGDHLHFSTMLHGVHVDPIEWWDAKWVRDHVTAKLDLFPHMEMREEDSGNGQEAP